MTEEKQIEEMALLIHKIMPVGLELSAAVATDLYNAGYRKQSEVEKLENKLFKDVFEGVLFSLVYLGADGKWHTNRNNAEKTTAIIERYLKLVTIAEGGEADA